MTPYIKLEFHVDKEAEREMLVAFLSDRGFEGFEETESILRAFIPENAFTQSLLAGLTIPAYTLERIEPINWNEQWESGFAPVVIDGFCAVRAGFHPPVGGVPFEIIITPRMSFGTGHHATTSMMISQMRKLNWRNASVLDFGTGTGILAILAEKMGAGHIIAIDNDDSSIRNAQENLAQNDCRLVNLIKDDKLDLQNQFDVILANIILSVIVKNLPGFTKHLKEGGVLIVSGLLGEDEPAIMAATGAFGLGLTGRMKKENWLCLVFEYQ